MKIFESNRLIKVKILFNGSNGWTLSWNSSKFKTVYGSEDEFAKFLRSIQAKDDETSPNSKRGLTYLNMAKEAANGSDTTIWVWEKYLSKIK